MSPARVRHSVAIGTADPHILRVRGGTKACSQPTAVALFSAFVAIIHPG